MLDFAVTRQSEPSAEVGAVAPSRLSLTFSCDGGGRTYLDRQFASYPFHVCRPHYFPHDAPGMATLYLQSSAGGSTRRTPTTSRSPRMTVPAPTSQPRHRPSCTVWSAAAPRCEQRSR